MKNRKYFSLTIAFLMIAAGIGCAVIRKPDTALLFDLLGLVSLLSAALLFFKALESRRGIDYLFTFLTLIMGILICFHRLEGMRFIISLFSFYLFFDSVVYFIQFFTERFENSSSAWVIAAESLMYAAGFILTLVFRHFPGVAVQVVIGYYLMSQGIQMLLSEYFFRHVRSTRAWVLRDLSALPVYAIVVIPEIFARLRLGHTRRHAVALDSQELKKESKSSSQIISRKSFSEKQAKQDEDVLRLLIHSGPSSLHAQNRLTFVWKGILYSYGSYDSDSSRFLNTLASGVLMRAPFEQALANSLKHEGETISAFDLTLNQQQIEKLDAYLHALENNTWRWYTPGEKSRNPKLNSSENAEDGASRASWNAGAKFRKFYHGPWKTYWRMQEGCTLFTLRMMQETGISINGLQNVRSAGESYFLLNNALKNKESGVVRQKWYFPDRKENKNHHPK